MRRGRQLDKANYVQQQWHILCSYLKSDTFYTKKHSEAIFVVNQREKTSMEKCNCS